MSYLITKATINMINGDKKVLKQKISTPDIELVRADLNRIYESKSIIFVYEDETTPVLESASSEAS